jgi:hypothetical protein
MPDARVAVTLQPEHIDFIHRKVDDICQQVAQAIRDGATGDQKALLENLEQKALTIFLLLNKLHEEAAPAGPVD